MPLSCSEESEKRTRIKYWSDVSVSYVIISFYAQISCISLVHILKGILMQTLSEVSGIHFPSKWIPFQAIATRRYRKNNLEKGTCLRSLAINGYVLTLTVEH